jgi:hypothetical protein
MADRPWFRTLALCIFVAVLVTGCGSSQSESPELLATVFAKKANSICRQAGIDANRFDERFDEYGERYDSDPGYSYADYWRDLSELEVDRVEDYQQFLRALKDLDQPGSIPPGLNTYLDSLSNTLADFQRQSQAAKEVPSAIGTPREKTALRLYDKAFAQTNKGFNNVRLSRAFGRFIDRKLPACSSRE